LSYRAVMSNYDRRRPVEARGNVWIRWLATWLARLGVAPNAISAASIGFSALAAMAMLSAAGRTDLARIEQFVVAAVLLELRLLANLLDGLVAVEGKRGSNSGEIWNELPDRFSDALSLVAAGYAAGIGAVPSDQTWLSALGWSSGLAAVITAYVRALGSSTGASAHFEGPMAKQRRMDVLAVGCILSAFEPIWGWNGQTLAITLAVILTGSLITIARRTRNIIRELELK
jgi:phosphatidylglycerophosphate synthase